MKKYFLLILLSVFLICSTIIFAGCDNTPDNTDENGGGTTETPSGDNTNTGDTSKFSLTTNIENCTIEGDKINITVSNDTKSFSFINAFNIPETYKWELHYDKACLPSLNVVSKSVDLDEGDNVLYALFINKSNTEDIRLYEINVRRQFVYTIRIYNQLDGSLIKQVTANENTKIKDLDIEPPIIQHYTFNGYGKSLSSSEKFALNDCVFENCNIYLLYDKVKYKVTFKNYDNSILDVIEVPYNEAAQYIGAVPQKKTDISSLEYYYFIGWDKELNNICEDFETVAQFEWRYNTVNFQYNQRYNADFNTYENYSISLISAANNDITVLYLMNNSLPLETIGRKDDIFNSSVISGKNIKTVYIPSTVNYLHTNSFSGESITEIIFEGSVLDWQNGVIKAKNWNATGNDIIVHCSNGTITEFYSSY